MLLFAGAPIRAQTLPAATPTTVPAPSPQPAQAPVTQSPSPLPPGRARIEFSNGLLTVHADNSSLNQILREISRLTGMTITGGVNDERVFGAYGPDDTGAILATLLGGTGSNMVLLENSSNSPRELVLTPRQGGPTPPSPSTYRDPEPAYQPPPLPVPAQQAPPQPQPVQIGNQAPPAPAQNQATPDSSTTQEQSPNGVKTPQQIYEELMKMQQQNTPPPHPED